MMRAVLAWLVVGFFALFFVGLVDSALQLSGRLPIPPCYLKLLTTPPATCMDEFTQTASVQPIAGILPLTSNNNNIALSDLPTLPAINDGQTAAYSDGPVVIHYDGDANEDNILALSKRLTTLGWPVQGEPQFVKSAPNTDQIRYYDATGKEAATSLARLIASILGRDIDLRDFTRSGLIAQDGLLEVWITQ